MVKIGGFQKLSLNDYPGKLACTVFLSGCNFRCPYCYSPELVLPEKIKLQPQMPEKEFFNFLKEKMGMLESVVICGGEPTINKDLPKFIKKIKNLGFLVKLDTNGSNPEMIENLIKNKLINYIAMDIKAPKEKYPKAIGYEDCASHWLLDKIERSLNLVKENSEKYNYDYEFRTTTVTGLLDRDDIFEIAKWISPAKKYVLQNFRPENDLVNPKMKNNKPFADNLIQEICKSISPFFDKCEIRD